MYSVNTAFEWDSPKRGIDVEAVAWGPCRGRSLAGLRANVAKRRKSIPVIARRRRAQSSELSAGRRVRHQFDRRPARLLLWELSVQPSLQVRQLLVELVWQVLAEAGEVLVDRGQLDLPLGRVDREQVGDFLG